MTTDHADPAASEPGSRSAAPRLRRRADDRVIVGVAGGIADFLDVDPLLVRAVFVGLMIFGAAGLVLYVTAWLFVPLEGSDESMAEGWIRGAAAAARDGHPAVLLVAVLAVLFLIAVVLPRASDGQLGPIDFDSTLIIAILVIVAGIAWLRRGEREERPVVAAPNAGAAVGDTGAAVETRTSSRFRAPALPQWSSRPDRVRRRRRPRESSPLALAVLGVMLVTVGALAAAAGALSVELTLADYLGAALALLGAGLLLGAWRGRARALILLGVLLAPVALLATYLPAPIEGTWGDQYWMPSGANEVAPAYRVASGTLYVDLTELPDDAVTTIDARVAMGAVTIAVPEDARVDLRGEVGAGWTTIFDGGRGGTRLVETAARDGSGADITLNLAVGIGSLSVYLVSADAFGEEGF